MTSSSDTATVATRHVSSLQSVLDRYRSNLHETRSVTGSVPVETLAANVDDLVEHRSRYRGWRPEGTRNASGSCRMVSTVDGQWVAINMARRRDAEVLGAVLDLTLDERRSGTDDRFRLEDAEWSAIEAAVSTWQADDLLVAVADLGLPLSVIGEVRWPGSLNVLPVRHRDVTKTRPDGRRPSTSPSVIPESPRVVDLSSLWAGPLCSRLLVDAGFDVITIESISRRDPSRSEHPQFHADLHRGKELVTLDFTDDGDRRRLRRMLETCDVVIEGSRRRALAHLGVDINDLLKTARPRVWVSITGYGYYGPGESRVGFGDDCAAAGGLVRWERDGENAHPAFVGDAVADPITGLVAAAAVLDCVGDFEAESTRTLGHHLQVSLAEAANWVSRGGSVATDRRDCSHEGRL